MTAPGTVENSANESGFIKPDIEVLKQELRGALATDYHDLKDRFYASWFLNHEQVLEVNGEETSEEADESRLVSATVVPCDEKRTIKIAHFHENIRKTPIPNTRFEIREVTENGSRVVTSGVTDGNGVAEIEVIPGRQYQVILSPQIKEADVQALYATYEDFIEKCCQVLDKSWSENASDEWDRFLRMGSAGQYAAVFLRAREGLTERL